MNGAPPGPSRCVSKKRTLKSHVSLDLVCKMQDLIVNIIEGICISFKKIKFIQFDYEQYIHTNSIIREESG